MGEKREKNREGNEQASKALALREVREGFVFTFFV